MKPELTKGNEAIVKAAILAGCRAYYGYPITPASEIAEAAALYFPRVGGVFIQAESETASVNMLYGGAAAGVRCMSASSGPGISLMQEGMSYLASAELPCVVADIMRGGPGLGNIAPEQGDYNQIVKGGGHGCYRTLVLAPASVQEMADFTTLAFDLADRYRNPVVRPHRRQYRPDDGTRPFRRPDRSPRAARLVPARHRRHPPQSGLFHIPRARKDGAAHLQARSQVSARQSASKSAPRSYRTDDAEFVLIGYGIMGRILKAVVDHGRQRGHKLGLLRPLTLYPFPAERIRQLAPQVKAFLVAELSVGQMIDDVRLSLAGSRPVEFFGRAGGVVPTAEEVLDAVEHRFALQEVLVHG